MPSSVAQCRKVRYESFDQIVLDAERAVREQAQTTGNWSLGQILEHLAIANDRSIDGFGFEASFPVRMLGPFFKKRVLAQGMNPGIQLSKQASAALVPDETDVQVALDHLRQSFKRLDSEATRSPHPILGRMSLDESNRLCLRHAELHMGFVKAS
jgi:hypothetical protein